MASWKVLIGSNESIVNVAMSASVFFDSFDSMDKKVLSREKERRIHKAIHDSRQALNFQYL